MVDDKAEFEEWKRKKLEQQEFEKWKAAKQGGITDPVNQGAMEQAPKMIGPSNGFMRGLNDVSVGFGQMVGNMLPDDYMRKAYEFNNALADKGVPMFKQMPTNVNEAVRQDENAYMHHRARIGDEGMDWDRMAGNVLNPAMLMAAGKMPVGTSLGGRMAAGAAAGGLFGAMQPTMVDEGESYWSEKGRQSLVGAAGGAAAPAVTNMIGKFIWPNMTKQVNKLRSEGVNPTIGQAMGGNVGKMEEKMMSLPLIGDAISSARKSADVQLNRAVVNRALDPIGVKMPKDLQMGRDAVKFVYEEMNKHYENLLPRLKGELDDTFTGELINIRQMLTSVSDEARAKIEDGINRAVLSKFTQYGMANGQSLKSAQTDLRHLIERFAGSSQSDDKAVHDALTEVQNSLHRMIDRANPDYAKELQAVNKAFANYVVLRRSAEKLGAEEGIFSPAQLNNVVHGMDDTVDNQTFARGEAFMQDLSDPAKKVLQSKYPDSGTAGRLAMGAGMGAAGVLDPTLLSYMAMGGMGALPYLPPLRNAASSLWRRPEALQSAGQLVKQKYPYLIPAMSAGLLSE